MSHTSNDPRGAAEQCLFSLYANAVIAGSSFMGSRLVTRLTEVYSQCSREGHSLHSLLILLHL